MFVLTTVTRDCKNGDLIPNRHLAQRRRFFITGGIP